MKTLIFLGLSLAFSTGVYAGPKEDFIEEVKNQCGKDQAAAEALATGGRQGNVMRWKTCASATVTVGDCVLTCTDASSKIGG